MMIFQNPYFWLVVFVVIAAAAFCYQLWKEKKEKIKVNEAEKKPEVEMVPWSRVNEVVEQERNRIASELHDELGTLLSIIHLDLELVLREASSLTPHGEARLLEIRKNLNLVIEAIRHNIWSLAPQMLEEVTLDFALLELCKKLDAYKGTHLHFVKSGVPLPITQKQKLNLFRIVQELLTNAIKHSQAWNISVQLHWDSDKLTIVVEDDGSLYNMDGTKRAGGGMGLTNIIKRINVIGASMTRKELLRGLRVTIELKLQNQNEVKENVPISSVTK